MNPHRLEELVAAIFKANYKDCEAIHVGKPDDGGIDVVFVDSGERQWLIQVKRRENPQSSEGVGVIRNLLGAMLLENSSYGILVSTANHFTFRAKEAVDRARDLGKVIRLIDRGKLDRMLAPMIPDRPWLDFLRSHYPELAGRFSEKLQGENRCWSNSTLVCPTSSGFF
jgi:hypothetical protein